MSGGVYKLFLDSGAYSAMMQGKEIILQDYIDFIKEHQHQLEVYANLDVIGDPQATWDNQKEMERQGLNPLPVFHRWEEYTWLRKYIDAGYDYLALGGLVGTGEDSVVALTKHFDNVFSIICDTPDNLPKIRTHGFGMTVFSLMRKYPWYSVDSSSWNVAGRFGSVIVPRYTNGKPDYRKRPISVSVSNLSSEITTMDKHFYNFSPMQQQQFLKYFKSLGNYKMGETEYFFKDAKSYDLKKNERWVSKVNENGERKVERVLVKGLSNNYQFRLSACLKFFIAFQESIPPYPQPFKLKRPNSFGFV